MENKPNLLLIWTDQQRPDTLKCYGNDIVDAPALNKLADQSFVFKEAYCAQPVCTPSRGTIMTGLWPHQHGAYTNNVPLYEDSKSIAEMVSDDYYCAYFGKWHLGNEIFAQHGFEKWVGIEDLYRKHYSDEEKLEAFSSYHHYLVKNGFAPDKEDSSGKKVFSRVFSAAMAEQYTKSGFLGIEASRFLREEGAKRPFVMSVNFLEPHPPIFGPLNDHYEPESLPLPKAHRIPPAPDSQRKALARAEEFRTIGMKGYPLETDWDFQRLKANYYGLVTLVDRAVEKILNALDEAGLADNTIVAFTSDHGEMLGDHALFKKGMLYEGCAQIPLLIRVPWLNRTQKMIDGKVSQIDLVPTLLDLLGEPVSAHLPGKSRVPVLKGEESLEDNPVFIEWNDKGDPGTSSRSIVTADGWKLNLHVDDVCSLYDLNTDPMELENLFQKPEHQDRIRELANRIYTWQEANDCTLEIHRV